MDQPAGSAERKKAITEASKELSYAAFIFKGKAVAKYLGEEMKKIKDLTDTDGEGGKTASLQQAVLRIAKEHPETRKHLLPLLRRVAAEKVGH